MKRCFPCLVAVPLLLISALPSWADGIPIGEIIFDVNIPSGVVPGINSFTLFNGTAGLTGPGPGIQDPLTFSGQLVLTLVFNNGTTGTEIVTFLGIGPGSTDIFDVTSADTVLSAVLTGTITPTSATINGGSSPVNLSPIFAVADPFNGGISLATCTGGGPCAAEIDAATSPGSVPEPNTLTLLVTGLAIAGLSQRRSSRRTA
jgi:hypothetical protein